MPTYDWSSFEMRIPVNGSLENIYKAWTTISGIQSWFLRSAKYSDPNGVLRDNDELVQKGDRYTWYWHGYDDDTVEHNDVLEANGEDVFSFVFAGHCIVTVTIGMIEGETIVELRQENIPTGDEGKSEIHMGCMQGWTFYLANLKSVLEGGIDLRNRNTKIGKVVNS